MIKIYNVDTSANTCGLDGRFKGSRGVKEIEMGAGINRHTRFLVKETSRVTFFSTHEFVDLGPLISAIKFLKKIIRSLIDGILKLIHNDSSHKCLIRIDQEVDDMGELNPSTCSTYDNLR